MGQPSDTEFRERFDVRDNRDWQLTRARHELRALPNWQNPIIQCAYRPFDARWCHFSTATMDYPRRELLGHVAGKDNLCLNTVRQTKNSEWRHAIVSNAPAPAVFVEIKDGSSVFPLYLYPEFDAATLFDASALAAWPPDPAHGNRVPNLSPEFVAALETHLGLTFQHPATSNQQPDTFAAEDILHYIYAILHSPTYRARYAEFLKIDFPRIPLPSDPALFWRLVALGRDLVAFHLLEHPQVNRFITRYPIAGDSRVEKGFPKFAAGRVLINPTQYFEGVPEAVWEFQVGGYQVLDKWLKDRRGRMLTFDDLAHYQKVVVALQETIRLMDTVDTAIPQWPLE